MEAVPLPQLALLGTRIHRRDTGTLTETEYIDIRIRHIEDTQPCMFFHLLQQNVYDTLSILSSLGSLRPARRYQVEKQAQIRCCVGACA